MYEGVQIEPVGPGSIREAMRFLVGGRRLDAALAVRAEAMETMTNSRGGPFAMRWARRGGQCVAVALVVASPGRTGMLYHCPAQADGVDADCLPDVVRAVSAEALAGGLAFVQSLVRKMGRTDVVMLSAAGYERLAELVYMKCGVAGPAAARGHARFSWRSYGEFSEDDLAEVIQGTYAESLDCPALCGLRELSDVVRGHKASGTFCPETWWIAEQSGRPAGCILLNDSAVHRGAMDVVYMGVVSGYRGGGLGRAMIRHAARAARRRGRSFLTLAVDADNVYAKRIYDGEGFREIDRRIAYIATPQRLNPQET